jgi:hypothetical protein
MAMLGDTLWQAFPSSCADLNHAPVLLKFLYPSATRRNLICALVGRHLPRDQFHPHLCARPHHQRWSSQLEAPLHPLSDGELFVYPSANILYNAIAIGTDLLHGLMAPYGGHATLWW